MRSWIRALCGVVLWATPALARAQTGPDTWSDPAVTTVPTIFSSGGGLTGAGGDAFYALHGGNTPQLSKYTISTHSWRRMAPAPASITYGGALAWGGGDSLYALRGNSTTFYRYSISGDTWTTLAPAPATTHLGAALVWDGGNFLYALRGNNSTDFWRYNIASVSWEVRQATPQTVYSGGSLSWDGTYVYALRGNSSTTFWRYDVGANSWAARTAAPASVGDGGALVWDKSNTIYAFRGNNMAEAWSYSISGNAWTALPSAPANLSGGSSLHFPGAGDFVYAAQGNSTGLLRYSVSSNAWSTLTTKPTTVSSGGALAATGNDYLYALRGNSTSDFWRYAISTHSWFPMAPVPATVAAGGALTWTGGDSLYAFRGNGTAEFYRYTVSTNTWAALVSPPATLLGGSALTWGGGNFLYAFRGNPTSTFWRYDISGNSWTTLTSPPNTVALGASLLWDGANSIYAFRGGSPTFWRYDIPLNTWSTLASAPETIGEGGSITWLGAGNFLYATQGGNTTGFMRYSISGNFWALLAPTPDTVYSGGSITYPGAGETLHALRGNTTSDLWSYRISADQWTPIAPATVASGGSLTSDGTYLYALRGNVSQDFWRYHLSSRVWTPLAWTPSIVYSGGALVWGGGDFVYALRGNGTGDFWRFSISANAWTSLPSAPDTISDGGSLVWTGANHNYIYVLRGGARNDFWRFNLASGAWETRASTPATVNYGAGLAWDGGKYLYALRGNDTTDFWRFDIADNNWTVLSGTPEAIGSGGALVYAGGSFYAFKGSILANQANLFFRYAGGAWSYVAPTPESVSFGGSLAYPGAGSYVYAFRGNTSRHFWRYQFQPADGSPPTPGVVNDGLGADIDWQNTASSISANWSGFGDPETGVVRYEWAIGTTPGGTEIQPFLNVGLNTTATAFVALVDGMTYYLSVRAVNGEGLANTAFSDGVRVDISPPGPVSVTVDSGNTYTSSTGVTLTTSAVDAGSGISAMRFMNDENVNGLADDSWSLPQAYSNSTSWTLSPATAGLRRVFAEFRDAVGNASSIVYDDIVLDPTPPVAGTVRDGTGADIDFQASATSLSANWSGFSDPESGIARYDWAVGTSPGATDIQSFVNVGSSTQAGASLALADGVTYFVTVRAVNGSGLNMTASSDGVTVDATAPAPVSVTIDSGAATTSTENVSLTLAASDSGSGVTDMRIMNDVNTNGASDDAWGAWQAFVTGASWGLAPTGSGSRRVFAQFRDAVGNVSTSAFDDIGLNGSEGGGPDGSGPIAGIVNDGTGADIDVQSSTSSLSANWSGFTDPESGIAKHEWAIGTAPGATDVQGFVDVGTATAVSVFRVLTEGTTYYVTVRATNGTGLTVTANSDGVRVARLLLQPLDACVPALGKERAGAVRVPMNALRVTAPVSEDVRIVSIRLTGSGSGNELADVRSVELFLDVDRNGLFDPGIDQDLAAPQSFPGDDGVVEFRELRLLIPAGESRGLLVVCSLAESVPIGATFQISLAAAADLSAVSNAGEPIGIVGSFPHAGRVVQIAAPGTTGSLWMEPGTAVYLPGRVAVGERSVAMAQIQWHATSVEAARIAGVRVRLSGTADDSLAVGLVRLVRDADQNGMYDPAVDESIDAKTPIADNELLVFTFLPRVLAAGSGEKWLIVYDLSPSAVSGTTLGIGVLKTDVTAFGVETGAAVTLEGCDVEGPLRMVDSVGSRLSLWIHPLPPPETALPFGQDVAVLSFDVQVGGPEDVVLDRLRIRVWGSGSEPQDLRRACLWRDGRAIAVLESPVSANDGELTFDISERVLTGTSGRWHVTLDLAGWSASGMVYQAFFDVITGTPVTAYSASGVPVAPSGGLVIGWWTPVQPLDGSEGRSASTCLGSVCSRTCTPWLPLGMVMLALMALRRRGGA